MGKTAHEIVTSDKFVKLVNTRWAVSMVLTILLFILYYGYIILVGYSKDSLKIKVGEFTNIGIILGVGVIIGSWILTMVYVIWANGPYDKIVDELKKEFSHK